MFKKSKFPPTAQTVVEWMCHKLTRYCV